MRIGDLVRIRTEHQENEVYSISMPLEKDWLGLVMGFYIEDDGTIDHEMVYIQWTWSGNTVLEYAEHLESI